MSAPALPAAVEAAVDWMVLLSSGEASAADRARFEAWHRTDPRHAAAWDMVTGALDSTFAPLGEGASSRAAGAALLAPTSRRRALRNALMLALAAGGLAALVDRQTPLRTLAADLRTGTGERRSVTLADGTRVELNAGSALDLRYTDTRRELVLLEGEILVTTASDTLGRPFSLRTGAGVLTPVGTRFLVRDLGHGRARVAVLEGAVDVDCGPAGGAPRRVMAGSQAEFSRAGAFDAVALRPEVAAWLDGMLLADAMPLADFLAELGRYRPGVLRCSPDAASLRVVGAFPVADTDQVLAMLQEVLPVRVRRYTRYWVNVGLA